MKRKKEVLTKLLLIRSNFIIYFVILIGFYSCNPPTDSKDKYNDVAISELYHIRIPNGCILSEQSGRTIIDWNELRIICTIGGIHEDISSQIITNDSLNIIKSDTIKNNYLLAFNSVDGYFNIIAYSLEEQTGILADQRYGVTIESKYETAEEKEFLFRLLDGFQIHEK